MSADGTREEGVDDFLFPFADFDEDLLALERELVQKFHGLKMREFSLEVCEFSTFSGNFHTPFPKMPSPQGHCVFV